MGELDKWIWFGAVSRVAMAGRSIRLGELPHRCPTCGKWGLIYLYRRNTAYADLHLNWGMACADCIQEEHEDYADLWADYYAGCM